MYNVPHHYIFPTSSHKHTTHAHTQPDFWNHPNIVWKLYYIFVSVGLTRAQYYLAWYLGEAGCVATGMCTLVYMYFTCLYAMFCV